MKDQEEVVPKLDYEFDFDTIPILSDLVSLHQDGNYGSSTERL